VARETAILVVNVSADGDLQQLMRGLPKQAGFSLVVMARADGHSMDSLAHATDFAVEVARDGMMVAPHRLYVCPPGRRAFVEDGVLHLLDSDAGSLAEELRETRARLSALEGEATAQRRTLIDELNHRVRNMLTVVGAIAKQTLVRSESPVRFTEAFLGRLQAMANSYNLIAKEQWSQVSLEDIFKSELTSVSASRVSVSGPEVRFKPSHAVALELVVHELVTNAVRHGPLAAPGGRLSVTWTADGGRVVIVWSESGGAKVEAPERHGFGLQLVERQIASALDGETSFEWAADGLRAELSVPMPQP
jgi:two-component system CheB/CheR fusion protein